MSDPDDRLKALFALDEPPARDPAFVLEIVRRMQRRRLMVELLGGAPWAVAASAILWAATPWLELMSRPTAVLLGGLTPAAAVAAGVAFLAWPRLSRD